MPSLVTVIWVLIAVIHPSEGDEFIFPSGMSMATERECLSTAPAFVEAVAELPIVPDGAGVKAYCIRTTYNKEVSEG